jgi:hypothetical protein
MNHTYLQKLCFLSLILAALNTVPMLTYAQTIAKKPSAAHAKPVEDIYFNADGRVVPPTSSLAATQVSAKSIGRVLSLLFDSARVNLQTEADPLAASWTGTITVPVNSTAKAKSYVQDVRGSVTKAADTRVVIVFEFAGRSSIVEFPYGKKHNGDITRRFVSLNRALSSGNYTASIWIFAERRNSKSALLVDIDSIDITAR